MQAGKRVALPQREQPRLQRHKGQVLVGDASDSGEGGGGGGGNSGGQAGEEGGVDPPAKMDVQFVIDARRRVGRDAVDGGR